MLFSYNNKIILFYNFYKLAFNTIHIWQTSFHVSNWIIRKATRCSHNMQGCPIISLHIYKVHIESAFSFPIAVFFFNFLFMSYILHEDMSEVRANTGNTPSLISAAKNDSPLPKIRMYCTLKYFSCPFPFPTLLVVSY